MIFILHPSEATTNNFAGRGYDNKRIRVYLLDLCAECNRLKSLANRMYHSLFLLCIFAHNRIYSNTVAEVCHNVACNFILFGKGNNAPDFTRGKQPAEPNKEQMSKE